MAQAPDSVRRVQPESLAGGVDAPKAFCLIGFWGVPNFGDEWLLRSAQNILRDRFPDCRISALVLSAATEQQLGEHRSGVKLIDGFFPEPAFFANIFANLSAIASADLMLIGGGGLINDTYTPLSIPRYTVPALIATACGRPVVWWGLGVVPPRSRILKRLAFWTLRHAALVLARDRGSRSYLAEFGVPVAACEDLSTLDPDTDSVYRHGPLRAGRTLVVNFRDSSPSLMDGRARFLIAQLAEFDQIVLLAAEPCDELVYRPVLERLRAAHPTARATLRLQSASAYMEIRATIAAATLVISERLHISLYSLSIRVPTVVLSYENKINQIIGELYPEITITSRDDFWSAGELDYGAASAGELPYLPPGDADRHRLAGLLRGATTYRTPGASRLGAACWLVVLVPLGAAIAALKLAKRLALLALSPRPATQVALDHGAHEFASNAGGETDKDGQALTPGTEPTGLGGRRSVTALH